MDLQSIILLVVGFGFIVFVHELGHFLAAKYVGIRCEQFALGFGQALFSWRKGIGFRVGNTSRDYEAKVKERLVSKFGVKDDYTAAQFNQTSDEMGLGETEYRFNWIPLGGYVKMLGQDDSKPGLVVEDARSYTSKSIGARMLVISAGVIMNIIFAGVAFTVLFMVGLKVPTAVVGGVAPMSPAQMAVTADGKAAPLQVGDRILSINGTPQLNDFRKIGMNTALAKKGEKLRIETQRVDGKVETVYLIPEQIGMGSMRLLGIGVAQPRRLEGPDLPTKYMQEQYKKLPPDAKLLGPGDRITQINGQAVEPDEFYKFDRALQASGGKPVEVTITSADGKTRQGEVTPEIAAPATETDLNFAGLQPRTELDEPVDGTPLAGKAKRGDIVIALASAGDVIHDPSRAQFKDRVQKVAQQDGRIDITVLRDGKPVTFSDIAPNARLGGGKRGLGIMLPLDQDHAVTADALKDSPGSVIPAGSTLISVNGQKVANWRDVFEAMRKVEAGATAQVVAVGPSGDAQNVYDLKLRPEDATLLQHLHYDSPLVFNEMTASRTTRNPAEAAWWGVLETRDSIQQVYLTLRRLAERSVPVNGIMGPVGMFSVGTKIASQGVDYLLWFLAIISANLAVVNFLPIPVVDGGHFLFLLIEKIQGKPVSQRTMEVAQYIGLALILSVFVMATYQDILRMISIQ